jgi:hypothetical protein
VSTHASAVRKQQKGDTDGGGFPVPLAPATAAGAVLLGFVALRRASTRARRHRRGGRLRLPPI